MIFKDIWLDIKAVQERDPAARSAGSFAFVSGDPCTDLAPVCTLVL